MNPTRMVGVLGICLTLLWVILGLAGCGRETRDPLSGMQSLDFLVGKTETEIRQLLGEPISEDECPKGEHAGERYLDYPTQIALDKRGWTLTLIVRIGRDGKCYRAEYDD